MVHMGRQTRPNDPITATLDSTRFVVSWVAEIVDWRGEAAHVLGLIDEAVHHLPQQPSIVAGEHEMDERSLLFRVVVETSTVTLAKAHAIRGLREALLGAGIGLEHPSPWAPLVLELDPSALGAQPLAPHVTFYPSS
jgi:hypothetical protein